MYPFLSSVYAVKYSNDVKHLEDSRIITDCQQGFRARRSCETNSSVTSHIIPLFHTGPESHELTRIDKYLDSWLNRTQFVKVLTDSHSP